MVDTLVTELKNLRAEMKVIRDEKLADEARAATERTQSESFVSNCLLLG